MDSLPAPNSKVNRREKKKKKREKEEREREKNLSMNEPGSEAEKEERLE